MIFTTGKLAEITFDDSPFAIVDFTPYLKRGGVFKRFRDLAFFREFRVNEEFGTLPWGDEIDIAPETLCSAVTGALLPNWMLNTLV
jgi:hypothetical protein